MSEFVRVAKTSELTDPGQMMAEVDDRIVVLMKVGGELFCLDDVCTHDGGPLSEGSLDNHTIACPSASRTDSIVIRSKICWKKPLTISRVASFRVRPRAWA